MTQLFKTYRGGTHRARTPEETFAAIEPHLASFGITRLANVTGLDRLGIPVYCAIRPLSRTLQISNGKGLRPIDAKVSALMESIETFHAEQPLPETVLRSERQWRALGAPVVCPERLPGYCGVFHYSDESMIEWVRGTRLPEGDEIWLPASAVYARPRSFFRWSGNGLASGNHVTEATLHGLYELIERHVVSNTFADGAFDPTGAEVVSLDSIADGGAQELCARIADAGLWLVLIRLATPLRAHVFMSFLIDESALVSATMVNVGYGAHGSAIVAATRAITEAAQSRLTYIHGSREDLQEGAYSELEAKQSLIEVLRALHGDTDFAEFEDFSDVDMERELRGLLDSLRAAGLGPVYRAQLTAAELPFCVVQVLLEGAALSEALFG
jgi:ribosomal protein S12 methylthiotransferase accessory factor